MTITIDSTDKRSVRALAVLSTSDRWHRGHTKSGRSFWAVPSSTDPNHFYMVDVRACTCRDHTTRGVDCAHMLAVRLKVAQIKATEPKRKPAASVRETLAERETREAGAWGVRPTPLAFTRDASIGGTIQAPEAARRRCLADDVWGTDGEGN